MSNHCVFAVIDAKLNGHFRLKKVSASWQKNLQVYNEKLWGNIKCLTQWLVWWVCVCRSKRVSGTDNSLTSSEKLFRVSSFTFDTCSTLLFQDAFSKEALTPACSPRSEFAVTLVASRPEDAFIDLPASSISGAIMLSIAVNIAFYILSSTVPTILLISLSILSIKTSFQGFHIHRVLIRH